MNKLSRALDHLFKRKQPDSRFQDYLQSIRDAPGLSKGEEAGYMLVPYTLDDEGKLKTLFGRPVIDVDDLPEIDLDGLL